MRTFIIKKDEVGRACSMQGETGNAYKTLVGKFERKRPLGRRRHSWEDI